MGVGFGATLVVSRRLGHRQLRADSGRSPVMGRTGQTDPTATLAARFRGVRYLIRQRTFGACLRKNRAVLVPGPFQGAARGAAGGALIGAISGRSRRGQSGPGLEPCRVQYVGVRRAVPAPVTEQLRVALKLKQLGRIPDYDHFLAELDHAWMECKRVLVPGGRICCVIGDILIPRKVDGRHRVLPLSADHIPRHRRRLPRMNLRLLRPPRPTPPADTDPRRRQTNVVPGRNERKSMGGWNPFHTARCCGWRYADLSPIGLGLS
jgi:hypothetical protein